MFTQLLSKLLSFGVVAFQKGIDALRFLQLMMSSLALS